jgi:hypothetical protein
MFFSNIKWHLSISLMPNKWHIDWALKFLVKKYHVLTLRTYTINKILTLRILIINKFHHNNIIHHNRKLILIITRKSLPLMQDKIRPHFRQVLINIRQVPNISQVLNIILIQQLVVDFHRYIQRVWDVPHQHPTQASRNPWSNRSWQKKEKSSPNLWCTLVALLRTNFRSWRCSNQCMM